MRQIMPRWIDRLRHLWRALLRRHDVDAELGRELRVHLEEPIDECVAAGMTPEDAR